VTALGGLTTQFHDAKTALRKAIATRTGQTRTMPPAAKGVMPVAEPAGRVDGHVPKVQPGVLRGYLSARVMIDRGGHKGFAQPAPTPTTAPHKEVLGQMIGPPEQETVPTF